MEDILDWLSTVFVIPTCGSNSIPWFKGNNAVGKVLFISFVVDEYGTFNK